MFCENLNELQQETIQRAEVYLSKTKEWYPALSWQGA